MRSVKFLLFALLCLSLQVHAQTFTGTGGLIPDNGIASATFNLNVSGLSPATLTGTHGLKTICLKINHTWDADLEVALRAPDGNEIMLFSTAGGSDDNFMNTCFEQTAATFINFGTAPFTGTYRPTGNIGYINNGQNGNGTWALRVFDSSPQDQGTLISWSLSFDVNAPAAAPFSSSELPIVVINTNNQFIPDNPKITANMGIIANASGLNHLTDPFNNYNGKIGMEIRGSSSQQFPKKNYSIETRDAAGNNLDTPLLGMPAENDWVLYASYTDKSLLNNTLAYQMFRNFGGYAPRTMYVELVLNNQYKGVYELIEKIKRDTGRVNISKLTTADTLGNDVTGGYIIKIDKTTGGSGAGWNSKILPPVHGSNQKILFQYDYPSDVDILPKQKTYIQNFVDSFEAALNTKPLYDTTIGWRRFADENSFIKFLLLNEVSKNVDGYRISTYLYKTKITKGNKLFAGPPWDYDIAFHNSNYCDGDKDTGWAYNFGINSCSTDGNQIPFWWAKLMTDTVFKNHLRCTYNTLRTTALDTAQLFSYINSQSAKLANAQVRNFAEWPIIGQYVWPNPTPIPGSYAAEITELKQYLIRRLGWLDANIPGVCSVVKTGVNPVENESSISIFPNPFTNELNISIEAKSTYSATIKLLTMEGRLVSSRVATIATGSHSINIFDLGNTLPAGLYLLQLKDDSGTRNFKVLKQ